MLIYRRLVPVLVLFSGLWVTCPDSLVGEVPSILLERNEMCAYSLRFLDDVPGTAFGESWQDSYLSWWTRLGGADGESPFYACGLTNRTRACHQPWWRDLEGTQEFKVQADGASNSVVRPIGPNLPPLFRPLSLSRHTVSWKIRRGPLVVAQSSYSFFPDCTASLNTLWRGGFESGLTRWWSFTSK